MKKKFWLDYICFILPIWMVFIQGGIKKMAEKKKEKKLKNKEKKLKKKDKMAEKDKETREMKEKVRR